MDKVTLIEKDAEFMTQYAAPSILTGRFVACVVDSDLQTVQDAFTNPGTIHVHNMEGLWADKDYTGYTTINRISEADGEITVVVERGQ